jgi:predicted transposase YbfD/YdcC
LECREVTPEQVAFPGARLIARLQRRVRRHGQKSTETVYLISSLTLEQLDARGWLKLKRGYWVIESRLHQALDVSLDEDRSRVRQPNAALVLGLFRRIAQVAIVQAQTKKTRWTVRRYQQRFAHRDGGPQRLQALIFADAPRSWLLPV